MKTTILTFASLLTLVFQSIGQINPVQNLNWEHWYENPNNFFVLSWDEPEQPHDEIIGYNIYRENDLFLFISDETSIYNIDDPVNGIVSNCGGEDFLIYGNGMGFYAHVTAVYNPGEVESDFIQTEFVRGSLLGIKDFNNQKAIIYPNPSKGIVNINNNNIEKIIIYSITGKIIKEMKPQSQIDLSDINKGVYVIKLISDTNTFIEKIILE
ncbi:T9SS type A sorting domain-containing protein [Aequorivita sp. Q41]|uniref:T9SS type A sorting domain-containing protein n=1 Tax=Aequorivita sp. Q41 TaxID=3153300 RepID=UPI003242F543